MKQHLAVSAIGTDRTGMVHELTRVITECGGSIAESRMAALGSEFAMLLLVSGNWHALARIESELARLAETDALSVHLKRTEPKSARVDMLPYSIDIVSLDQTGIVAGLSGFFASRGIDSKQKLIDWCAENGRLPAREYWDEQWVQTLVRPLGVAGVEPHATHLEAKPDEMVQMFQAKDINVVVAGGETQGAWRMFGARYERTVSIDAWR